jgi:16S rRNA processing protein RimM
VGEDFIAIGRISKPHGVKGEIRIAYFNPENPHVFSHYQMIYLQGDEQGLRPYRLLAVRPHKQFILAQLEGIQSRAEAEKLKGKVVFIDPAALPPLEADEYYWQDILGMRVVSEQGEDMGTIKEIVPTGSNDVYVVQKGAQEFLIPATKDIIIRIDIEGRMMTIRPLEGLLQQDDDL